MSAAETDTAKHRPPGAATDTGEYRLLTYRVARLEEAHKEAVGEIRDALKSIDKSLQALAVVEVQNTETRQQLAQTQTRMSAIEQEIPTLKLARKWVLAAMTSGSAAVGAGVVALIVR